MTRGQKIAGVVAGAVFLIGLVSGFWPLTINSPGLNTTGVECGSAFAPDNSPTGTSTAQTWADVLGYENNGLLDESPQMLARSCEIYLEDDRVFSLVLTIAGLVGLLVVGMAARSRRRTAQAAHEAQWRAQGWVPPSEAATPPPGWVRAPSNDPRGPQH